MTDFIGMILAAAEDAEHSGVKGMKWGVRKDEGHEGKRTKTKKIEKLDKKFERNANSASTFIKVNNKAASETNSKDVDRINNKPEYKDQDFNKPSELRTKYYKEHEDAFLANLEKAASSLGTNASGTRKYTIAVTDEGHWNVTTTDVKHDDLSPDKQTIYVAYDDNGYIKKVSLTKDELEHSGVKGMKWGVRKKDPVKEAAKAEARETKAAVRSGERPKGQTGPESSADRYNRLLTKAKVQGANSFSDDELNFVTRRGNAINQVNKLNEQNPNWIEVLTKNYLDNTSRK